MDLSIYLSVCPSIHLSTSTYRSIWLSIQNYVCVYPSVYIYIYMYLCLWLCQSISILFPGDDMLASCSQKCVEEKQYKISKPRPVFLCQIVSVNFMFGFVHCLYLLSIVCLKNMLFMCRMFMLLFWKVMLSNDFPIWSARKVYLLI